MKDGPFLVNQCQEESLKNNKTILIEKIATKIAKLVLLSVFSTTFVIINLEILAFTAIFVLKKQVS